MELSRIEKPKYNILSEYNLKCVTLGDQGVGKTTMSNTFTTKQRQNSSTSTIGVAYACGNIKLIQKDKNQGQNPTKINMKIWDTAGSERFRSITASYIRNSYIVFILFDLTDRNTWKNVNYWKKISKYNDDQKLTDLVLIGCKSDLRNHQISINEIKEKAKLWNCKWYTLSCKQKNSVSMVHKIFYETAENFHNKMIYNNKNGYNVPKSILDDNNNRYKYADLANNEENIHCCQV